jgi:predicted dehydrogenase
VGVIGTGFGRATQLPAFLATPGVEVVAVVSRSLARAYETAKQFNVRRAFDAADLDRFLALDDLDLVSVSSPPATHRDYTLRSLRAGKHVLCEKPTALDAAEARDMLAAARAAGRLALLDHELRFDATRRRLRDLVRDGYLGHLQHVQVSVESDSRADPARPWSWWSDAAQGGGVLGAIGSHVVDAVRFTFGEVQRGRALLRAVVPERPDPAGGPPRAVTADDYAALWLELEGGATVAAVLSVVSRTPRPGWAMSAHGTLGTLLLEADGILLGRRQGAAEFEPLTPPAVSPPPEALAHGLPDTPWARAFLVFAGEIAGALAEGRTEVPQAADFADGLRAQQVLDALRESARRGDWIECGPEG